MKISSEGYTTIGVVTVIMLVSFGAAYATGAGTSVYAALSPLVLIWSLILYFFRDPERIVPADESAVVSPADGKVVMIETVTENEFLRQEAIQISIFLSVFNVHVNRIPVTGIVRYVRYIQGEFLAAFNHAASVRNEQSIIGIETAGQKILFKQIAGLLARRIVYHVKESDPVVRGNRFGIIKFGSRVDVIVPKSVDIKVALGDIVYGGESVLAILKKA